MKKKQEKKNMNKILVVVVIILIGLVIFTSCSNCNQERYEKIKKDFEKGLKLHLNASYPSCTEGTESIVTSEFLINQGYIKKDILLDVEKKSYCKANAKTKCVDNEMTYTIYLKCESYESDGYVDW